MRKNSIRAAAVGFVGVLIFAGRAGASPDAAEEAAALPGKIADATGPDAAKREVATEWLLNTVPQTLPLIEKAAADAAGTPGGGRLGEVVSVLKPLDAIRSARSARAEADEAWNRRTALAAYDAAGTHSPAWDADARRAIALFVSLDPAEAARSADALQKLVEGQHCTDPLIRYLHAAKLIDRAAAATAAGNLGHDQYLLGKALESLLVARDGFADSAYPADRKAMADARLAALYADRRVNGKVPDAPARLARLAAELVDLWPDVLAVPDLPMVYAYSIGQRTLAATVAAGNDRGETLGKLLPALAKTYPGHTGVRVFEARGLTDWAWDARGVGMAQSVTPEGWRQFHERLQKAEKVLEAAYAADPSEAAVPVLMLMVGLGEDWPAARMDWWFARGRRADPDLAGSYYGGIGSPFVARMHAMRPQWGGSDAQMLAFGRKCLAGRNWRGGTPTMLLTAHEWVIDELGMGPRYWRQPQVWADLDELTAGPLRIWPGDVALLSARAFHAWRCGQWKVADALFEQLGDRCVPTLFGGPDALATAKASAAAGAAKDAAAE